jgi:hypothetical protein
LKVADPELAFELRGVLQSGDDYASAAKPQIDWEDEEARAELVDSRAKDGFAMVMALSGRELPPPVKEAATLLLTVLGQDLEEREDGVFAIARRVAPDRVISTVDVETRHGHKSSAHGFDGYKGHVAIDPDSELVTATRVTPGNLGDAGPAAELLADVLEQDERLDGGALASKAPSEAGEPTGGREDEPPVAYGDNAYGTGELHGLLERSGVTDRLKTQSPVAPQGRFSKDRFAIDLEADTVTCPAEVTVTIRRHRDGSGTAAFNGACATCPLRDSCTASPSGRVVTLNRNEEALAAARSRQTDPAWRDDYRATRPKVERKLAHLMFRRHGGRRARVRGRIRVDADFSLLAGAHNLARLALLGLHSTPTGWSAP